jgi:hypothetical protein
MLMFASATIALAAPALAAPPPQHRYDDEVARNLPSPDEVEQAETAMDRALDAMMDIRVGPIEDAVPGRHLAPARRNETLGDLARRDDPYFDEKVHGSLHEMTDAMNQLTDKMAAMAPVIEREVADMKRHLKEAKRELKRSWRD